MMPSVPTEQESSEHATIEPTTECQPERRSRRAAGMIPLTGSQLERLARSATEVVNRGDFDHETEAGMEFTSYVSHDFQAILDNYSREPLTWRGLCATWKMMARLDPSVFFEIRQIFSDVNEELGEATVCVEIAATGVTKLEDVKFLTMSVLSWRRDRMGRWWYYRYHGMLEQPVMGALFEEEVEDGMRNLVMWQRVCAMSNKKSGPNSSVQRMDPKR